MLQEQSCEEQAILIQPKKPSAYAHKYSRGKLIICGGSKAYPGAVCMSAWASQYMGAGYTEVFTDASHLSLVQLTRPSLVVRSFEEFKPETVSYCNPVACVVGPGFDANDTLSQKQTIKALSSFEQSLLLDGGALVHVCNEDIKTILLKRKQAHLKTVLTPHGGEAARLAQAFSLTESDSLDLAKALSVATGAVVVLKGPETIVSDGLSYSVVTHGTPALAKAGTGDVLSGMIGALLAQGVDCFTAAVQGVSLHADAGNCAAERYGVISVCAEEVIQSIPEAINESFITPRTIIRHQGALRK